MAQYHKVVWSEGMFLSPHHFQQLDRYYEGILNFRLRSAMPLYWGLMELKINRESLENGNFNLISCRGIFPTGVCIDIPDTDGAPANRAIKEFFTPSQETLDVYLAIPTDRPGSINFQLNSDAGLTETRYFTGLAPVVDESTGYNEQEITVAKKNLKIVFGGESLDGYDYIKIAELRRGQGSVITLKEDYIPPCISISASEWLMRIVSNLTELLSAKSDELRERSTERGDGFFEFGARDVSNLWSFQTVNSFIPELNHFYNTRRGHPEDLFRLLSRFAGALSVFSARVRPIELPGYDHEDLSRSFGELDVIIQELLRALGPTRIDCILITLEKTRESADGALYEATILDSLFDPRFRFYLAAKGTGNQAEFIIEFPRLVKIASTNEVNLLIGKALRGISLSYSATPPMAVPRRSGFCYFNLDPQSDFWPDVQKLKRLAIHIPATFRGVELELMAVIE